MARNKNHHLVKRVDVWYFRARIKGRVIKKRLSTSLVEARKLRDQILKEIALYGNVRGVDPDSGDAPLFGEIAMKWAKITEKKVKKSTFRGYRIAMNSFWLKRFGDVPINKITYLDIEEYLASLDCSGKRINNLLVPLRGVFKLAHKSGFIDANITDLIQSRKIERPQIHPLSIDDVNRFLECVDPFYKPFFNVAFYTGMRAGEMSALKWDNVDFERRIIRVVETRVYGEEGRPKTTSSYRDIDMLSMVYEALQEQASRTRLWGNYVFLNKAGKPIEIETLRKNAWTKGLKKAGLEYRPIIQTRHTFATIMISSGENLGWVQRMMGHSSLKMITDKYFSYIPNITHNDGSKFMEEYEKRAKKSDPKVSQEKG